MSQSMYIYIYTYDMYIYIYDILCAYHVDYTCPFGYALDLPRTEVDFERGDPEGEDSTHGILQDMNEQRR